MPLISRLTPITPITPITPVARITPVVPIAPISDAPTDTGPVLDDVVDARDGDVGAAPVPTATSGFVSARSPRARVVVYSRADGTRLERTNGTRAWRNNNPGNIEAGSFAATQGAIGSDGRFAIFPDRDTGREAIVALLRGASYRGLSLEAAINRYAPPHENQTSKYVDFVEERSGVQRTAILGDLRIGEVRKIADVIGVIEGWEPGQERELDRSTAPAQPAFLAPAATVAAAEWMAIAEREAALPRNERSEWPDPGENPRILRYLAASDQINPSIAGSDETAWCASFVNYCLEEAGFPSTNHPGARSFFWNRQNHFIRLSAPASGAVAVFRDAPFSDPNWAQGSGHVGFVVRWDSNTVAVLGGNQSNTVKEEDYAYAEKNAAGAVTRKVVAYMMPRMN